MVGSEQKAAEDTAADHPAKLEDRADEQRRRKADDDDPRQLIGEPTLRHRKGVQHELEPDGDDRQAAVIVSALIMNSALSGNRRNTPPSRDRGTAVKVR